MAETSLFAQRLQAITERRRLQERILALRRELEEERLRAQRLKRKSLRDRWLMEGMSAPPDDSNHTSSVWEAHSRIQELEQDLSSLQSQMQQLDNPQQQSKESANSVKEVLVTSPPPPEGRSSTEPSLELAPVPPKRMMRTSAEDKLQNGEMSGDGMFGIQPSLPSQKPDEAHPSHQRKLAVEEMVIRDHLGQAVGSMDAVGQKQSSIGKEDDLENSLLLGCDEGKMPGPLCDDVSKEEELPSAGEGQGDGELGCRHGPEGQSPTSLDQEDPSRPLKDKALSPESSKEQGDGELPKEVVLVEDGEKGLPVEAAMKMEHAQELAAEPASAAEPATYGQQHPVNLESLPDSPGAKAASQGEGGKELEDLHEQTKPPFPDQNPTVDETKFPDTLEEIEVSLQSPIILSSSQEQISHIIQDTKASLPGPISSIEETEAPLLEPKASLLPDQGQSTVLDQVITLEESQGSIGAQIPSLVQESLLDPSLPSLQDPFSSPDDQKPLEAVTPSLEEPNLSLLEQIPSHGAEKDHPEQIPTSLQEPGASLLPQSLPPLPDQLTSLPENIPSPLQETEELPQEPTALQVQEPSVLEAAGHVSDVTSSLTNEPPQEPERVSLGEIPVELQDQMATASGTQGPFLQDDDSSLQGQKHLSSVVEGEHLPLEETSDSAPDPVPPALQDQEPTSPQGKSPSLPGAEGPPMEQRKTSLPSPTAPALPEARETPPGQAPPPLGEEAPTPLQSQASPVREVTDCQGNQIPPSLAEERPTLPNQTSSSYSAPSPALQEAAAVAESSSQEPVQPLLDKTATGEEEEMKEGGSASLGSRAAGAGGSPDLLEHVPSEQQPLLKEPKTSAAPAEISLGDQEPQPGTLKLQTTAGGQEAPTYHTSSTNTASSRQLRPHQGEGQDHGQSRRKQKSCQCCSVM